MIWVYRTSAVCDYFCSVVWISTVFLSMGRRSCPVGWQQRSKGLYVLHLLVSGTRAQNNKNDFALSGEYLNLVAVIQAPKLCIMDQVDTRATALRFRA
jgi:hypothetical protein